MQIIKEYGSGILSFIVATILLIAIAPFGSSIASNVVKTVNTQNDYGKNEVRGITPSDDGKLTDMEIYEKIGTWSNLTDSTIRYAKYSDGDSLNIVKSGKDIYVTSKEIINKITLDGEEVKTSADNVAIIKEDLFKDKYHNLVVTTPTQEISYYIKKTRIHLYPCLNRLFF